MTPRLKKALGQHHLVDGRLCRPLVDFLAPRGRRVIEIGPGGGVLTAELLTAGAPVLAWEVDPEWAFELRRRHRENRDEALQVLIGDALDIPWERLPGGSLVAGNLPYNVATVLIAQMLQRGLGVERAAFLVQKEVADRLVAQPGDSAYGALSVLVAARAERELLGRVRAGSFRPPPKVDGGWVGLVLRPPPLPPALLPAFEATVHAAFSRRRKTLRNSLGSVWGRAEAERALAAAGISPDLRAERLDVAQFVALTREGPGRCPENP